MQQLSERSHYALSSCVLAAKLCFSICFNKFRNWYTETPIWYWKTSVKDLKNVPSSSIPSSLLLPDPLMASLHFWFALVGFPTLWCTSFDVGDNPQAEFYNLSQHKF